MDLGEAASALGVHYQTGCAWVRQGILPARKAGAATPTATATARWQPSG